MNTSQFWINHFKSTKKDLLEFFLAMTPDDCVEILRENGFSSTKGISFESAENRVFGFDDAVIKFYRPGRWNLNALKEEVQFLEDLNESRVPFVRSIGSVGTWKGIHYIIFKKIQKSDPLDRNILDKNSVRKMAHVLANIHEVGEKRDAPARAQFDPVGMCSGCYQIIKKSGFLPESLYGRYEKIIELLILRFSTIDHIPIQRIHGDTYSGNIIWLAGEPIFIDLDDFQVGPVALDIQLLSSGWRLDTLSEEMDRLEGRKIQHQLVLDFYREVRPFPKDQEVLFPLLSAYRDIQFDTWFCSRWNDPGFAKNYKDDDITSAEWWINSIEGLEESTS